MRLTMNFKFAEWDPKLAKGSCKKLSLKMVATKGKQLQVHVLCSAREKAKVCRDAAEVLFETIASKSVALVPCWF